MAHLVRPWIVRYLDPKTKRRVPKGTPGAVLKYVHDAVKGAMEDPQFVAVMKQRVVDVDYRAGDQLKADLWKEYKSHGEILGRLGLIKKK